MQTYREERWSSLGNRIDDYIAVPFRGGVMLWRLDAFLSREPDDD